MGLFIGTAILRDPKDSCRAAFVVALPAATRTGNVLLADANGALPAADGVALVVGNRVLLPDAATATGADRGIYVVDSLGGAGSKWQLSRAPDADSPDDVTSGMQVYVSEGTASGRGMWVLTTPEPIALNTTSLSLTLLTAAAGAVPVTRIITAGAGLTGGGDLSADRTLNVVAGDTTITVTADAIVVGTVPGAQVTPNFGAQAITAAVAGTITRDAVATSQLPGWTLRNTTDAALGAQQFSPGIELKSKGWETTGGTSQAADWLCQVAPIQGAALTSELRWSSSINGAAYTQRMALDTSGVLAVSAAKLGSGAVGTTGALRVPYNTVVISAIDSGAGNVTLLDWGVTIDALRIGGAHTINYVYLDPLVTLVFRVGGANKLRVSSTIFTFDIATVSFEYDRVNATIKQNQMVGDSPTTPMYVTAMAAAAAATGVNRKGGKLVLSSGAKTADGTDGDCALAVASVDKLTVQEASVALILGATAAGASAGAGALPATPQEFLAVTVGGNARKIPLYLA